MQCKYLYVHIFRYFLEKCLYMKIRVEIVTMLRLLNNTKQKRIIKTPKSCVNCSVSIQVKNLSEVTT